MKILIISQYFWPENYGAPVTMREIAEWLLKNGHEVTVLTGFPNYPEGDIYPGYRGRWFQREEFRGIRIVRTWLYATSRTRSIWQRILSQFSFSATLFIGALFTARADVVLNYSPPLPSAFSAAIVSILKRARFVVSLQDLEPERSIELGLVTSRWLVRMLRAVERFVYWRAESLCVLSDGTREYLIRRGVTESKIQVTPNWADGDLIKPAPKQTPFRVEMGLSSEFVVLYSGNMGYTMDLETVIEAAWILRERQDIVFVFVGDGVKRATIQKMAEGLNSVRFMPLQPLERLHHVFGAADLGMVIVSKEATNVSVPSKVYCVMAAARPVIAMCKPGNDVGLVVTEAACGTRVDPGDAAALASAICNYADDPQRVTLEGERARACFEGRFTREIGISNYERVLVQAANASQ
jgi:putative colanic acid biosynthesis glycosyltransferase WcaI